jgi:outer membrane lipoprotein SlyB
MSSRPASFCVVLLLAGCATHAEQSAQKAPAAPVAAVAPAVSPQPAGVPGTILAMRPVPAEPRGPARLLLASFGGSDGFADGHNFEFIVRTASGTTISIVQPRTDGLHAGQRVSILGGAETRIEARAAD